MVRLDELWHEPCAYLRDPITSQEQQAEGWNYVYSFSSHIRLLKVPVWSRWRSPLMLVTAISMAPLSTTMSMKWDKPSGRRLLKERSSEKTFFTVARWEAALRLFTLNPGFLWMGFLKNAGGQHLACFQTKHPLFFFPSITIMPQSFTSTRFAVKRRNHCCSQFKALLAVATVQHPFCTVGTCNSRLLLHSVVLPKLLLQSHVLCWHTHLYSHTVSPNWTMILQTSYLLLRAIPHTGLPWDCTMKGVGASTCMQVSVYSRTASAYVGTTTT